MTDLDDEFDEEEEDLDDLDDDLDSDADALSDDAEIEALEDDDLEDPDDEELEVVDKALSQKDQNARTLAIRRALEQRMEDKKLHDDLDYLDLDD